MIHFCLKYYMNANELKSMPTFLNERIRSSGVGHFLLGPGKKRKAGKCFVNESE